MVWRIRARDEWVYVYVLLEFQSARDRWMALRVQVYTGLLYQDLIKGRRIKPGRRLPAVLPVVFYNGEKPWNAALDLAQIVEPLPDGLDHFRPTHRYVVIDQRRLDPVLLANTESMVATLFRMELSDWPDVLREVIPLLAAWLRQDEFEPVRRTVGLWLEQRFVREFQGRPYSRPPSSTRRMAWRYIPGSTTLGPMRCWTVGASKGWTWGARKGWTWGARKGWPRG